MLGRWLAMEGSPGFGGWALPPCAPPQSPSRRTSGPSQCGLLSGPEPMPINTLLGVTSPHPQYWRLWLSHQGPQGESDQWGRRQRPEPWSICLGLASCGVPAGKGHLPLPHTELARQPVHVFFSHSLQKACSPQSHGPLASPLGTPLREGRVGRGRAGTQAGALWPATLLRGLAVFPSGSLRPRRPQHVTVG